MSVKIVNKVKFKARLIELILIIFTIIIMPISIAQAYAIREVPAPGGEWLIPILTLSIIGIIETFLSLKDE